MAETFKVGDVVHLKSGSPDMTVTDVQKTGECYCEWFQGGEPKRTLFPPDALKRPDKMSIG